VAYTTDMQLNKLGYDRERGIVEFALRRSFDDTAIIITGEVPMAVLDATRLRSASKAAVRQALIDAADALVETDDLQDAEMKSGEGNRLDALNESSVD
jgi:hypothetical protein